MPRINTTRRGLSAVYGIIMLTALIAFVSLGVDLGRVQLAKTELRRAADAAARYAATGIADGTCLSKAQVTAAENFVDGDTVSITAGNVQTGNWDSALNPRFSTSRTPTNAVQVSVTHTVPTVFMQILGWSQCEVSASAIVAVAPNQPGYGFVGLNWVQFDSNATTDSYDSSVGAYSSSWSPDKGSVASNGSITLQSGNTVRGDARPGPGKTCTGGTVTGVRTPLPAALTYSAPVNPGPPYNNGAIPSSYISGSNFILDDETYTLPAGTYSFANFTLKGDAVLNVSGSATIYISGTTLIDGDARTGSHRPQNLKFCVTGSGSVSLIGNNGVWADIYAPLSDILFDSNKHFYGMAIGKTLQVKSNVQLHLDESLNDPVPSPFPLTLVD